MCTNSERTVSDLLKFVGSDPTFLCRIHSMISRSSRPNTADLQPQVPPLSSPRFKHELCFKHVDNRIVELHDVPRARAPGDVVHKHSNCGALTRHRSARYRRRYMTFVSNRAFDDNREKHTLITFKPGCQGRDIDSDYIQVIHGPSCPRPDDYSSQGGGM
jgi:hypothetical protein